MAIKVAKLENLFWTNGSWERPNTLPDDDDFHYFPNLIADWNDNKTVGVIILTGDWNYAYCEEQYYFLKRLRVADRENTWVYGLVKDWWANWINKEVSVRGYCTKTNDKELLLNNIDYVQPVIQNPCRLYRLNLSTDVTRHWWEDLEDIRTPSIAPEFFNRPTITSLDWWKFLKQIEGAPIADEYLPSQDTPEYKKGVTIVAELETSQTTTHWKQKVLKKLETFYNKDSLKYYTLTKVTQLGETTVKNLYALTLENKAIGEFEETARVIRLDFSSLRDISISAGLQADGAERKVEFQKLELNKKTLDSTHRAEISVELTRNSKKFKVLQRKVYLPYLRKSWALNDDFLYSTSLTSEEKSNGRAQDTSAVSGYAEVDPLVPIYQGQFAQGLKSKTKPSDNFYLPWTYQLDSSINYTIKGTSTTQGITHLNNKIEWFAENSPPEFGFLIFGQKRNRTDWTWWHYLGDPTDNIDIITGLREGWEIPNNLSYDRDVDKWVTRVRKWWSNFDLLNSLYPYSWIYYFSALRDDSLKISFHDWDKWGGNSGFFNVKPKQEGTVNFSLDTIKSLTQRNVDNNTLDLKYFDNTRNKFFDRKAIIEQFRLSATLEKGDIFFSDLTAFWEEYDSAPSNFKYAQNLGWYLDTKKDHRILNKSYKNKLEPPKLIFYWNNNIKKYQIGIYYIYKHEYDLAKQNNDIIRVKFREDNATTARPIESADDGVTHKTVLYHHIKPIRNEATKQLIHTGGFELISFIDFCKAHPNVLEEIDNLLQQAQEARAQFNYDNVFKRDAGVPTGNMVGMLPRIGTDYNYEAIFQMLQVPDNWTLGGDYYKEKQYYYSVQNFRNAYDPKAIAAGWQKIGSWFGFNSESEETKYIKHVDFLKFGNGSFTVVHSLDWRRPIPKLRNWLLMLKNQTTNVDHLKGERYEYPTTAEFFTRINDVSLQKDIYQQMNLLDADGKLQIDDINIKNKLFTLEGTGYELWIDAEEDAHLIFTPHQAKADICLEETKTFRLPHTEVPTQDYIDAINQQTDIQIATATYPLQERLLFNQLLTNTQILERAEREAELSERQRRLRPSDEDEELEGEDEIAVNSFKIQVHRFSIENKQNPNDYYIIEYQGARQLLDVKLGIPKRTVSSRASDIVALAELSFQRERWREEFRNRQSMWEVDKNRQFEQFAFNRERLVLGQAEAGFNMAFGVVNPLVSSVIPSFMSYNRVMSQPEPIIDPNVKNGLELQRRATAQWEAKRESAKFGHYSGLARTGMTMGGSIANSAFQLANLSLQGRELQADINQAVAQFAIQASELKTEHTYNSRHFAMQLSKIGNVFQQGEVNDRDINDQYNAKKGLNEVHLIYRVPSQVQREGLERYYNLYGSDCQIPEVEFKFEKVLRDGAIWQFSFIDQITNLWAVEEKEVLKTIFANGFKILSLRKVRQVPKLPTVKPWTTRADELLQEANPLERNVLFNKLTIQLDRLALIKHLAENEPDKNALVDTITPYLDKTSLLAKLAVSKDKGELTRFVLKLLNKVDDEQVFEELLKSQDKGKLVEKWIDGGTDLTRTLWDKYPERVVSKEHHNEEVGKKDKIISDFRDELRDTYARAREVQRQLVTVNQTLSTVRGQLQQQKNLATTRLETINKQAKELASAQSQNLLITKEIAKEKQNVKTRDGEIASQKKQIDSQIIKIKELEEQLKELPQIKEKADKLEATERELKLANEQLKECNKSLTTLREIEQAKASSEVDVNFLIPLLSEIIPRDYDTTITYIFNTNTSEYFIPLYQWDTTYCCWYLAISDEEIIMKKFWGASNKGWAGSSWDIQFFWKFKNDTFKNNELKSFWNGGYTTDFKEKLARIYSDRDSYDNSVYVGSWKVIYDSSLSSRPRIRNKIGSSGYTIDTLELETPLWYKEGDSSFSTSEGNGRKQVRLYKDYLKLLGLKWNGEKVVPNTLN